MKLIEYMRAKRIDDDQMASLVGGITGFAVKKWKYGEREPSSVIMVRIEEITGGLVKLADWAEAAANRATRNPEAA